MARKKKHSSRKSFSLPVAAILGFLPLGQSVWAGFQAGGAQQAGRVGLRNLTGYDTTSNSWNWTYLKQGTIPIAIGLAAHKLIGSMLGVNRMLGRAGIPFIRI